MAGPVSSSDRAHQARALAIAEQARGRSSPNPPVGCVLVRDGTVVGEGATREPGGPHAEAVALAAAGSRATGASAYVTLEPCAHHGRTPPCAGSLATAGVRRVVYGLQDPHPAAGGGARALRAAGVEVVGGVLGEWVARQLEGFLTLAVQGRPHVTLKLAHTPDGAMAVPAGTPAASQAASQPASQGPPASPEEARAPSAGDPGARAGAARRSWITGAAARTAVHRWRASVDAVLVGSGTVLADDPRLDVRHVAPPPRPPRAVVLDARLRTPPTARVARPGTVVVTAPDADPRARRILEDTGVDVRPVSRGDDGHLDLAASLAALAEAGVTSVLAEPGPRLAGALVRAGLVDRLVAHVAPGPGPGPLRLPVDVPVAGDWRLERLGGAGEDLVLHLLPPRRGAVRPPTPQEA